MVTGWMHGAARPRDILPLFSGRAFSWSYIKSNDKDCSAKKDNSKRPLLHHWCPGLLERPLLHLCSALYAARWLGRLMLSRRCRIDRRPAEHYLSRTWLLIWPLFTLFIPLCLLSPSILFLDLRWALERHLPAMTPPYDAFVCQRRRPFCFMVHHFEAYLLTSCCMSSAFAFLIGWLSMRCLSLS